MLYLTLTVAMMWFPPILNNPCDLSYVECGESPTYIQEYIRDEFNKAGLDGDKAVKIAYCESRFKTDAVGYNRNGSNDKGVFQINSIHGLSDDCRLDLKCSTEWAIEKVKRDKGWSAWTCSRKISQN